MRILITGGAGFQGSHITERLLKTGHEITILNHRSESAEKNAVSFQNKCHIVWGSVADEALVCRLIRNKELVLHLAAKVHVEESIAKPSIYVQKNILGTFAVLEAIKKSTGTRPKLIHWSTCEVYGQPASGLLSESSELRPHSPYAASKAAADRLCFSYHKTYGLDVIILRPFNIFGERQKIGPQGSLISTLVENAINDQPLIVQGDGRQTRDYMHISDLVTALELVVMKPNLSGHAINFASGINTSVIDIAKYIAKRFGVKIIFAPGRPGEILKFPADISLAKSLGFKAETTIWQGIDRYIDWRLHQKSFSPAPSKYNDWILLRRLYQKFLQQE